MGQGATAPGVRDAAPSFIIDRGRGFEICNTATIEVMERHGVAAEITELATKLQIPIAAVNTSKAIKRSQCFFVGRDFARVQTCCGRTRDLAADDAFGG
jgi:hypothetical protein